VPGERQILAWLTTLEAHEQTPHGGGAHPDLATHDALGLTTDGELAAEIAAHVGAADPHVIYSTDADLTAHAALVNAHHAQLHVAAHASGAADAILNETAPSTQAFGDAPAQGADATKAAKLLHKHGMPANPVTAHEAAGDPHPVYSTDADLTAHVGAADPHPTYSTDADLATHASAGDPHTGYVREADANYVDLTDGGATTLHSHAGGGDDARLTVRALTADQADITGITLVEITGLTVTALGAGTYQFRYMVIYQTTATTTGVEFVVDHTGTVTEFVSNSMFGTTGGAAATGIGDQQGVGTAAGLMEVKTARAKNTRPGVTIGVDTANADLLMLVEGVLRVTVSGDLKLFMAAELAALVVRARRASSLVLVKVG